MTKTFRNGTFAATVALIAMTGVARADVTPQDVWEQWQSYLATFGYKTDSQPVAQGPNLHLPAFEMVMLVPASPSTGRSAGTARVSIADITLVDRGDGTVSIEIPASTPVTMTGADLGPESFDLQGTMTSEGYALIASGNPGDITYDYTAERLGFRVDSFTGNNGPLADPAEIVFALQGTAGSSRIETTGDDVKLDQTISVAEVTYSLDLVPTTGGEQAHIKGSGALQGLSGTGTGTIPAGYDPLALSKSMTAGYEMKADIAFTGGRTGFDFSSPDDSMRYSSSSKGGDFTMTLGEDGLDYGLTTREVAFTVEGSQVPFPVASTMGAFRFHLTMPVVKQDEPQDFALRLGLTDLDIPDPIWMMIDNASAMSHDPLTAEIDLSGKARLLVDIFDEASLVALETSGQKPGEVTRLSLDRLLLKAGGATVAATGGFDVDNTAKSALNPSLPAFSGQIDMRLTGVLGLLQTLASLNIVPMPQAMMASGMIQQLGKPENGPDDLSAVIEVSKDQQVTINGAPLPFR